MLNAVFHRVWCLGSYCLILIRLTCVFNVRVITLLATLMILLPIPVHKTYHLKFLSFKELLKKFDWCKNNHIKANPEKCHVILTSNTQMEIRFDNTSITSSLSEKLLGITLDSELNFEEHINKIYNIVNKKLNPLHRIASHMS